MLPEDPRQSTRRLMTTMADAARRGAIARALAVRVFAAKCLLESRPVNIALRPRR